MVPKIHAKGCSFKGIARYLLHDKDRATTSDRVAWTATRNLATEDPDLAWKLLAATAMDADRLKAKARVKNTGRKSKDAVLHLTLSWHPDEADELTKEEMLRASEQAIRALGAEDRQALIVAHSDEQQPHAHVVISRVSPEDGRMLSSSNEKLKLSRWAQAYEEERGAVLCEQRAINNAARDRGEYVRGEKDVPRHIYEQHLANDNRPNRAERHRRQREKDRDVGKRQRQTRDRQSAAWAKLMDDHRAKRLGILADQRTQTGRAVALIQKDYRETQWRALHHAQQAETRAFERNETRFLGRMNNRLRALDFRGLIGGANRSEALRKAFNALSSSGERRAWLKRDQERQRERLLAQQRREEAVAARGIREAAKKRLASARVAFQAERASLVLRCSLEDAKIRAEWRQRMNDRQATAEHGLSPGTEPPQAISEMIDAFNEMRRRKQERSQRDRENDPGRGGDARGR